MQYSLYVVNSVHGSHFVLVADGLKASDKIKGRGWVNPQSLPHPHPHPHPRPVILSLALSLPSTSTKWRPCNLVPRAFSPPAKRPWERGWHPWTLFIALTETGYTCCRQIHILQCPPCTPVITGFSRHPSPCASFHENQGSTLAVKWAVDLRTVITI